MWYRFKCHNIDEISRGSSTQKFDGANSKKEKQIDSFEDISTDLLNENNAQQGSSYSITRNEDYIHAEAILRSPLCSASEKFNDAKIGLKVMKKNFPRHYSTLKIGWYVSFSLIFIKRLWYSL